MVLHCFAGQPREGDVEDWLLRLGAQLGILFLVQSVDIGCQPEWDLRCPDLIALLLEAIHGGLIDFVLGGPPCSTWSVLRFLAGGPRPLRFRDGQEWGRTDLTDRERESVESANILLLNFLALCEQVRACGGSCLLEHPADPGRAPYPSIFATEVVEHWKDRIGGYYTEIDQCMFGGVARKPTGLITDMPTILDGVMR